MPIPLKDQSTPLVSAMSTEVSEKLCVEEPKGHDKEEDRLVYYYLRVCRQPHYSFFSFEFQHPFEFLEHFGYDHVAHYATTLLRKAIGDEPCEEYRVRAHRYYGERRDMKFGIRYYGNHGLGRWTFGLRAVEDEEPTGTLLRIKERLEFVTGLKLGMERLLFFHKGARPLTHAEEIVNYATQDRVLIGIKPRPGYPQNGQWDLFDLVPMIAKVLDQGMVLFPLVERFRIWTVIWGTSKLVTKLIEVNPDLLEEARSLGVGEEVFSEILNYPIPPNPGTELIPLELLESVCLIKGLLAYMNAHGLIKDSASYDLTPKEV